MKVIIIAIGLLLPSAALAQQQPRQLDLQSIRDQLGDAAMAAMLCNNDAKIAAQNYQRIIADLQKENADLKAKYEPKNKDVAPDNH